MCKESVSVHKKYLVIFKNAPNKYLKFKYYSLDYKIILEIVDSCILHWRYFFNKMNIFDRDFEFSEVMKVVKNYLR